MSSRKEINTIDSVSIDKLGYYGTTLGDIRNYVDTLITQYSTDTVLEIEGYTQYDSIVVEAHVRITRLETDKERDQRDNAVISNKNYRRRRYENLKKEFE